MHIYLQIEQCLQNYEAPMDGVSLKHALHQQGINLRYLGHMMKAICQSEHKQCLRHILVRFVSAKINAIHTLWQTFLTGLFM